MSTSPVERPVASPQSPLEQRLADLPLRERKKLRTRRAIQDHAIRLFAEQGYDATTVEQIAAAAEVSPSTFFRYFPTKEDVIVTDEYDPLMAQALRAQPPGLTPIDALRAVFRDLLPQVFAMDQDHILTRTKLMISVPALRARTFESTREGTLRVIAEALSTRVGRPADDPDVQAFSWAVMGVLQAAMYAWLDSDATLDLPALVDHNLEFLAAGCPL